MKKLIKCITYCITFCAISVNVIAMNNFDVNKDYTLRLKNVYSDKALRIKLIFNESNSFVQRTYTFPDKQPGSTETQLYIPKYVIPDYFLTRSLHVDAAFVIKDQNGNEVVLPICKKEVYRTAHNQPHAAGFDLFIETGLGSSDCKYLNITPPQITPVKHTVKNITIINESPRDEMTVTINYYGLNKELVRLQKFGPIESGGQSMSSSKITFPLGQFGIAKFVNIVIEFGNGCMARLNAEYPKPTPIFQPPSSFLSVKATDCYNTTVKLDY